MSPSSPPRRSSTSVPALFLLGLVLGLGSAAKASAQGADDDARVHFDAGRTAYAEGRFDVAIVEFRRAYVLSGRYALLFNIGMAELRAGHDSAALTAFEGYRRQAPADAPDRSAVEERIRVLRGMGVEPDPSTDVPPPITAPPPETQTQLVAPPPPEPSRSVAPILLIGGGAAAAVVGGVMMGLGHARANDVTDAPVGSRWADLQETQDKAQRLWGIGIGLGAVGVATAAVGTVLAITSGGSDDDDAGPTANLRIGAGFVAIEGTF